MMMKSFLYRLLLWLIVMMVMFLLHFRFVLLYDLNGVTVAQVVNGELDGATGFANGGAVG